jgi:hypothetical protein
MRIDLAAKPVNKIACILESGDSIIPNQGLLITRPSYQQTLFPMQRDTDMMLK